MIAMRHICFAAAAMGTTMGMVMDRAIAAPASAPLSSAASVESVYGARCAACHGARLEGGAGPALISPDIVDRGMKELTAVLKSTMPLEAPGSLADSTYTALSNYILARNVGRGGH